MNLLSDVVQTSLLQSALNTKLRRPDAETPAKNLPISARSFKLQLRVCDIIIRTSKPANRTSSDIFPHLPLSDELWSCTSRFLETLSSWLLQTSLATNQRRGSGS